MSKKKDGCDHQKQQNILECQNKPSVSGKKMEEFVHLELQKETTVNECIILTPSWKILQNSTLPLEEKKMEIKEREEKHQQSKEEEYVIVEFPLKSNQMTSIDSKNSCDKNIQSMKLSQISEVVSTLNGDPFKNLSKEVLIEKSTRLWSPTKIDSVDLDLISYRLSLLPVERDSQCLNKMILPQQDFKNKSWLKTSSALLQSSAVKSMEKEDTLNQENTRKICVYQHKKGNNKGYICAEDTLLGYDYCSKHMRMVHNEPNERTRIYKIRIKPYACQKKMLRMWFGHARKTYNLALAEDTEEVINCVYDEETKTCKEYKNREFKKNTNDIEIEFDEKGEWKERKKSNKLMLRDKLTTNKNLPPELEYLKKCPQDIREFSITEYITNKNNAFQAVKAGRINHFRLNFKSKKNMRESIEIPKTSVSIKNNKIYIYPTYMKQAIRIHPRGMRKHQVNNRLWDKKLERLLNCGEDILNHGIKILKTNTDRYYLAIPYDAKIQPRNNRREVAIDPGVRTFLSTYSSEECLEYNHDKLNSLIEKVRRLTNEERKQRKYKRIEEKIANIRKDFHHKTALSLLLRYNKIFLPTFETSKMAKKKGVKWRRISKRTTYQMLRLGHYAFKTLLKDKAELYSASIVDCNEAYTSVTCSSCLNRYTIGGSKIYNCPHCGLIVDRDRNSAKNIYLLYH